MTVIFAFTIIIAVLLLIVALGTVCSGDEGYGWVMLLVMAVFLLLGFQIGRGGGFVIRLEVPKLQRVEVPVDV